MNLNIQHFPGGKQGHGPALVLFHGWGFDGQIWQPVLPLLTIDFNVYCVDLPGFGQSEWMEWTDFKNVLHHLLPPRYILLGWSMGGMLAVRLACEHPEKISHLINVASSPRFIAEEGWPGINQNVFDTFYERLQNNPTAVMDEFIRLQCRGTSHQLFTRALPSLKGLTEGLHVLQHWDLRPEMYKLSVPALYLFGYLDAIVPKSTAAAMTSAYPKIACQIFSKAAHALFLSHSELWYEKIKTFNNRY